MPADRDDRAPPPGDGGDPVLDEATLDEATLDGATLDGPTLQDDGALGALSIAEATDEVARHADVGLSPTATDRYQTQEELGRGGIGQVVAAFDTHLGREIAMKSLLTEGVGSSQGTLSGVERRFVHEARITGQLEHPGIVPVHELGLRPDGSLYYTMKRVRGRTLSAAIRAADGLPGRLALLGHVLDVCQALAYAHSRGIVHRDLKPANVMVGGFGETVVLDWGLAKHVGEPDPTDAQLARELETLETVGRGQTVVGTALGTPAYMSPEQARGEVDAIDPRSDVWGLGAVLYEVLTGVPPHTGDRAALLDAARAGVVVPVRERCPEVPPELAAVTEKALSLDPDGRYADASVMAAELDAWMQGLRVSAFQYSSWDLVKRVVARNKALSAVVTAALLGGLVGGIALFAAWRDAGEARGIAESRAQEAAANEKAAHASLATAYAEKAQELLDDDRFSEAAVFAAAAMVHSPSVPGSEWYDPALASETDLARLHGLVADARDLRRVEHHATLGPFGQDARWLHVSPDGRLAAVQRGGGRTELIDLERGEVVQTLTIQAMTIQGLVFVENGDLIAPSPDARAIRRLRPDGTVVGEFAPGFREDGSRGATRIAATPDGAIVAVLSTNEVRVFRFDTGEMLSRFASIDMPWGIYISEDGSRLFVAGTQREAALVDTRTGRRAREWMGEDVPTDGRFLGDTLLLSTPGGLITVDARTGAPLPIRTFVPSARVSVSADRTTVLSQEPEGLVLRDARTLERLEVLPGPGSSGPVLASLAGDRYAVVVESDPAGRVYILRRKPGPPARFAPSVIPTVVKASPSGTVLGIGHGSEALVLDARTQREVAALDGVIGPTVLSDDRGEHVVVTDNAHALGVFSRSGDDVELAAGFRPSPDDLVILPAMGYLGRAPLSEPSAAGVFSLARHPGPVRLYDFATGTERGLFGRSEQAREVRFSPDGTRVAICKTQGASVHAVSEPDAIVAEWALPGGCLGLGFAPDGDRMAAIDGSGAVRILDGEWTSDPIWTGAPPQSVRWTDAGLVLDLDDRVALLDPEGTPLRETRRREPGALVAALGDTAWIPEGRFLRRASLERVEEAPPTDRLEAALTRAGLALDGFTLQRPSPPRLPDLPQGPRAVFGRVVTSNGVHPDAGTVRLLDRETLEPVGEPLELRYDGTFGGLAPEGVEGEVGLAFEGPGFARSMTLSSFNQVGQPMSAMTLTTGGEVLVHELTGIPDLPGIASVGGFLLHTDGARPPAPVGCGILTSDPPRDVVYTSGQHDAALGGRDDTNPADGQATIFNLAPVPHVLTATVGDESVTMRIPAVREDYTILAFFVFLGPDPTPPDCH